MKDLSLIYTNEKKQISCINRALLLVKKILLKHRFGFINTIHNTAPAKSTAKKWLVKFK